MANFPAIKLSSSGWDNVMPQYYSRLSCGLAVNQLACPLRFIYTSCIHDESRCYWKYIYIHKYITLHKGSATKYHQPTRAKVDLMLVYRRRQLTNCGPMSGVCRSSGHLVRSHHLTVYSRTSLLYLQASPPLVSCVISDIPASTNHLYTICTMLDQRRRRWAVIVQMTFYKCCTNVLHILCVCWDVCHVRGFFRHVPIYTV